MHYLLYYCLLLCSIIISSSREEFMLGPIDSIPEMQQMAHFPDRQILIEDPTELMGSSDFGDGEYEELDRAKVQAITKSCTTMKPDDEEQLNVTFLLYTRRNSQLAYLIRPHISRGELLQNSPFSPGRSLKWITHGYRTDIERSGWLLEAKDKILAHEDSNVILTDWRRGASGFYPKAAGNAHTVAKIMVKFLHRIRYDLDFSQIHLIGHSLGAHIVGFVGSAFTEEYFRSKQQQSSKWNGNMPPSFSPMDGYENNQLVGRITACDPALPCFGPRGSSSELDSHGDVHENLSSEERLILTRWTHLQADSAVEVEVIHSNPGVMGYADPLGDYDFYANGFELQPGCRKRRKFRALSSVEKQSVRTGAGASESQAMLTGFSFIGQFFRQQLQRQSSFLGVFSRFQSTPVHDIFSSYTCSHHRSVQYLLESMYYNRAGVYQDHGRLEEESVCQMIGYRCSDYVSFKRGFCFTCRAEGLDCRSFSMNDGSIKSSLMNHPTIFNKLTSDLAQQQQQLLVMQEKWNRLHNITGHHTNLNKNKFLYYNYQAHTRYSYYFDTRLSPKQFCVYHYHLLIKYRWYVGRDEHLSLSGLRITGTLNSVFRSDQVLLYRYTHQTYTRLFTHSSFLGQIESVILFGNKVKTSMIEFVQVTFMSNLDAQIRAIGSAHLCLKTETRNQQEIYPFNTQANLFARCSGHLV